MDNATPAPTTQVTHPNKKKNGWKTIVDQRYLWLLAFPAIVCVILFNYAPMSGIYMAFTNYSSSSNGYISDLTHAPFVGLYWFKYFFENDFGLIMRNTLGVSLLSLLFGFPMPIIIAVLLNEVRVGWAKKGIQTASYLPYFISWVVAANLILTMFSANGIINDILQALHITTKEILFFQNGKYFWWILAIANMWKGMGYNAIIYLAAISGIDQEQYEAADIDGATRSQKIRFITLPALKPTIMILLILSIGGILNTGFEQILLLQNSSILNYADVLDTYSYRYGMVNGMYSYGTAVGLFKAVVSFLLVIFANKLSKKYSDAALF
ncbi:ABC transporter permease [Lacticaseibacillus parakribbianus]|uniref:ABC transporter permease n=1 Tax=Lacticaseibacillus parakribbianus TaxID=2970927 RepID=UPI0021CB0103|nr:ABC transporter permease subunit [Lacticaseibacillus parakribbianus]